MDEIEKFELDKILIEHEGLKLHPYRCSAGFLTIGIGRNLDTNPLTFKEMLIIKNRDPRWIPGQSPITVDEAIILLHNSVEYVVGWLRNVIEGFDSFDVGRRFALIDLGFCLGRSKFLSFRKMRREIGLARWEEAEAEMRDSNWARQVQKSRVEDDTYMMRTGELPERFRYHPRESK